MEAPDRGPMRSMAGRPPPIRNVPNCVWRVCAPAAMTMRCARTGPLPTIRTSAESTPSVPGILVQYSSASPSMPTDLALSLVSQTGVRALPFSVTALWNGGWASRDVAAVQRHVEELASLGVAAPTRVPIYFPLSVNLASTTDHIQVLGPDGAAGVGRRWRAAEAVPGGGAGGAAQRVGLARAVAARRDGRGTPGAG